MPRRSIDTKMWNDSWFTGLDPLERYLFQYLMTNGHTELCGFYELPLRIMAFESGLDMEMVSKIINRFSADKKVFYHDGWICIINYENYQVMNPSMKTNADNSRNRVPYNVFTYFRTILESADTVSAQCRHIKDRDKDKDKGGLGGRVIGTFEYLKNIPVEDLKEYTDKFQITEAEVRSKAEDLLNWCEANGKRKKNYKAFLRNAIKKDYGVRTAPPKKIRYEEFINDKGVRVMRQIVEK